MPKIVDHDQRRSQLIDALWRIASRDGLEAVSLGQVAAEAGVSKGLVQHYFRSKDEMLVHATTSLRERVERRIVARAESGQLRAILLAFLPFDQDSRTEMLVANAFFFRALHDPAMAERFATGNTGLRQAISGQITAAQDRGEMAADLDPDQEATILLALVNGLASSVLMGHHTPESAEAALNYQLAKLAS
nr:TetR/AcrR family transcriptional regulator [Kibdelosporangium sp. MJ126-NF4]CEL22072.1 Transcriptional regulator, TetR family [Kibdelosporangium sp. MJ126-NF4]CTQ92853.1 Transcriptional regulator, TetR family [Kibdelosporangium sp. MJ126-NF4]